MRQLREVNRWKKQKNSYTEEELGKAILNYNINTQEYKNVKEKFSYLNNGEDLVNFILNI